MNTATAMPTGDVITAPFHRVDERRAGVARGPRAERCPGNLRRIAGGERGALRSGRGEVAARDAALASAYDRKAFGERAGRFATPA